MIWIRVSLRILTYPNTYFYVLIVLHNWTNHLTAKVFLRFRVIRNTGFQCQSNMDNDNEPLSINLQAIRHALSR